MNTPTPGNDYTTLEIPYAVIYDDALYVLTYDTVYKYQIGNN
ncbi:MAG: hypothetical protein ACI4AB_06320 [Acetatifactor sp.]